MLNPELLATVSTSRKVFFVTNQWMNEKMFHHSYKESVVSGIRFVT